ncbi:MAG: 50S ribosomal protein L3 N(5)-glutamine methyltransferase [Legionellales bacterium]|nr:50S ribosomal protein L3 N(5)-glutamine methyltransferase [Legionellales bacterium]|tara:strand:- start:413 stop:1348 length:936 start_codon:yes stop_codon:yes gene_type:complete
MSTIVDIKEATSEMITVIDLVRWIVSHMNQHDLSYGHGTENSWDEAVNLVLSSLHLPPDVDKCILEAKVTQRERKILAEQLSRRLKERVPVPYLVNEAWFAGLNFYVDERVIIPRSPIAELIESEFTPWVQPQSVSRILDLCCGSACIGISCALAFPDAQVDAVDISPDALAVAQINLERYECDDNLRLVESDLFNALEPAQYDIIISNPPYVSQPEMDELPAEYLHEPRLALEAGDQGLDIVQRILAEAHKYLAPGGVLIVEVGYTQNAVEDMYPHLPFTWLQFERGGEGVFLLTAEELAEHSHIFSSDM